MHPTRTTWYFFFLCLIQLLVAAPVQAFLGYTGLVLSQLFLFFVPAVFLAKRRGGVIDFLRLREVPISAFFWAFLLSFLAIPVTTLLNAIVILFLETLGMSSFQSIDIMEAPFHPAVLVLIFAVIPGLCEELVFRGFFLRSLDEKLPLRTAIMLSSVFFGLIHFNVYNFLSPIYLGVLFALLVHIYDSIIPAVLGHTFFNAIVYYIQLTVDMPGEIPETLTLRSVLGIVPLTLLALLATEGILRRLYLGKQTASDLVTVGQVPSEERSRKWSENPEEVDQFEIKKEATDERYQHIPSGVWLPLLLSLVLFVAMTILSEWFMRAGIYV